MCGLKAILFGSVLCLPGLAVADSLALTGDPFNEVLRDAAEISGVVVAGVLRHGAAADNAGAVSLAADLPPDWAGSPICARVLSSDGLYEATSRYELDRTWNGGVATLSFPTIHGAFLTGLEPGAVAVQITQGDCQSPMDRSTVALWNAAPAAGTAVLLVNAFRADEVFAYVGDAPAPVRCEPLPLKGLTAYDHGCTLPEGLSGQVEVSLYRIVNGKPAEPATVRLWLGGEG